MKQLRFMKKIVVFCGSSEGNDPYILEMAYELGALLARNQITLVYGAARIGVMGRVAAGALDHQGKVIGVIPEFLKKKEVCHPGLTELIVTQSMHERKRTMYEVSDSVMALPGGFGTLEEVFEMITWAQLGLHRKPIGVLNIGGFYDELFQLLDKMVRLRFLKPEHYRMVLEDRSPGALLAKMEAYQPVPVAKWIQTDQL